MKKKLTLDEVATLLCSSTRTIKRNAKQGNLPEIKSDGNELFMHEEDLLNHFDLENLEEPFISLEQAEAISGYTASTIKRAIGVHINSYKLSDQHSSKLLFRESEILEWTEWKITVSLAGSNYKSKYSAMQTVITWLLKLISKNDLFNQFYNLSEREIHFLRAIFIEERNLHQLSDVFGISVSQCRNIFNRAVRKMLSGTTRVAEDVPYVLVLKENVEKIKTNNSCLKQEITKLQNENDLLREQLKMKKNNRDISYLDHPLLDVHINDLDLSVRTYNCLFAAKYRTLRHIINLKPSDLLKLRNFGKNSLIEVEELLQEMGLYELWKKKGNYSY